MVRVAASVWILMVCFIVLSSGAPSSSPPKVTGTEGNDDAPKMDLSELHIWDDNNLSNTGDIPAFNPVPVDTNNNCPSCLPDALLSGRPRW